MKKIFFTLCTVLCTGILPAAAQGDMYYTEAQQSTYNPLVGGTPFLANDAHRIYDTISLSFDITIAGVRSNKLYVTAAGAISTAGCAFQDPHIETFGALHSGGSYTYRITGNPGDRTVTLQFKEARFDHDNTKADFINYQVILLESDNTIVIHFGKSSIDNPIQSYFFNQGGAAIGMEKLWLNGDPAAPVPNPSSQSRLDGTPAEGQMYYFALRSVGISDAGKSSNELKIFPNPAKNEVYLNVPTYPVQVQVNDMTGRTVLKQEVTNKYKSIDISALRAGMYLLHTDAGSQKLLIAE